MWNPGEPMPDEPMLSASDQTYRSGTVGINVTPDATNLGTSMATYRFFQASNTMITEDVEVDGDDAAASPWTAVDIGAPLLPGGSRFDDDCLSILAAEGDSWDEIHFVYQELLGDVTITARVSEAASESTFLGVTLRESLHPDARRASTFRFDAFGGAGAAQFEFQDSPSGSGRWATRSDLTARWLRIERRGNVFIGSSSANGTTWTEIDRVTLQLPEDVLGGIAANTQDQGGASTICDIEVLQEGREPYFLRGDSNADGTVNIADGVSTLLFLFAGGQEPPCQDAADTDDSGEININDSIGAFNWLFQGAAPPAPPGPQDCGADPTDDPLDCANPHC